MIVNKMSTCVHRLASQAELVASMSSASVVHWHQVSPAIARAILGRLNRWSAGSWSPDPENMRFNRGSECSGSDRSMYSSASISKVCVPILVP